MRTAMVHANESKCKLDRVGASIEINGFVIISAYNGTLPGTDNCCEETCRSCDGTGFYTELQEHCSYCKGTGLKSKSDTIHAEDNMLNYAARYGIAVDGGTAYVTTFPCKRCARRLAMSGIVRVYYMADHKDDLGAEVLDLARIPYEYYNPEED